MEREFISLRPNRGYDIVKAVKIQSEPLTLNSKGGPIMTPVLWAAGGTGFTFLMTTLGASVVFFFRKDVNQSVQRIFLGFAAGVMIAASVWSLLIPAIEEAEASGTPGWIPAAGGFVLGVLFLILLDTLLPHLHPDMNSRGANEAEGLSSTWKRTTLLVMAVTLHNIPEGMAVGLAFALAAQHGSDPSLYTAALALAIGIGIQNFPEGAAISLPLRQEGLSTGKAFLRGSMSGIVEPIFGILTVIVAGSIQPLMPWLLSFAAGAMMYVVVEELIPEAHLGEHSNVGTLGVMFGFLIMMILDVALG
jgi:ZIP family zinc transporter